MRNGFGWAFSPFTFTAKEIPSIAVLPGCTIEAAEKLSRPSPLPAEEPFGWLLSLFLFFDERTATLSQRPEGLVARNSGEQFVHIPGPFRFGRRLKQHQIHVVHHAAVLADMSVLGEKVVDRRGLHFGHHRLRIIGAGRIDGDRKSVV